MALCDAQGETKYAQLASVAQTNDAWQVSYYTVVTEIAKRKLAEDTRERENLALQKLLDASTDPMLLYDSEMNFVAGNTAAALHTGVSLWEMAQKNAKDFLSPEQLDRIWTCSLDSSEHRHAVHFDEHDEYTQWDAIIAPIFDAQQDIVNFAYIAHDMSSWRATSCGKNVIQEGLFQLLSFSPQLMVIMSLAEGRILEANDAFYATAGFSREETVGLTVDDLKLWNSEETRKAHLHNFFNHDVPAYREIEVRRRDGTIAHGLCSMSTISWGNQPCILALIVNITDRKNIEASLRLREERYRSIVEDQIELICRYRPDGRLSFVNESYARYYNKNREELLHHNFVPNIPDEDLQMIHSQLGGLIPFPIDNAINWRHSP